MIIIGIILLTYHVPGAIILQCVIEKTRPILGGGMKSLTARGQYKGPAEKDWFSREKNSQNAGARNEQAHCSLAFLTKLRRAFSLGSSSWAPGSFQVPHTHAPLHPQGSVPA